MSWRISRQFGRDLHPGIFIEAICDDGVGHHKGVHGCDGCCANAPKEIWDKVSSDEVKKKTYSQTLMERHKAWKDAKGINKMNQGKTKPHDQWFRAAD